MGVLLLNILGIQYYHFVIKYTCYSVFRYEVYNMPV